VGVLVKTRREGTFVFYSAADVHVCRLLGDALFHADHTDRDLIDYPDPTVSPLLRLPTAGSRARGVRPLERLPARCARGELVVAPAVTAAGGWPGRC